MAHKVLILCLSPALLPIDPISLPEDCCNQNPSVVSCLSWRRPPYDKPTTGTKSNYFLRDARNESGSAGFMRLKLITCEIFYREFCSVMARSPNTVDVEFLPKGLHDIGVEGMRTRLQTALDRVDDPRYEAVLMGYGLCNNGVVGLTAGKYPLVIPRAHDCITLFLGGAERYLDYFNNHPGVYFMTTGWMERGKADGELSQLSVGKILGVGQNYEDLMARYGEDNAKY